MKTVKMCAKCNAAHIEQFEKLMEGKEVTFKKGCIGKCKVETPACKVDKAVLEAATVEELAAMV